MLFKTVCGGILSFISPRNVESYKSYGFVDAVFIVFLQVFLLKKPLLVEFLVSELKLYC